MRKMKNCSMPWRLLIAVAILLMIGTYLLLRWYWSIAIGDAELYFLGLRDADAAIVRSSGEVLVIDTGAPDDEAFVLGRLAELGIEKVDILILSHPDKDHIGNAKAIVERYPVGMILMPDVQKGSELEAELMAAIVDKKIPVEKPLSGRSDLRFGSCQLEIFSGRKDEYRQINDASLVTILHCSGRRVFFGGDIENKRMEELLLEKLPTCDVVKLPHHGKDETLSASLLRILRPQLCVVTADTVGVAIRAELEQQNCFVWYTPQGELGLTIEKGELRRMEIDE